MLSGISCVRDGIRTVDHYFCHQAVPPIPDNTMPCDVPCHQKSCRLSEWSPYGPCSGPCGVRKRFRSLQGMSRRVSRCHHRASFPIEEHQECPCPKYRVLPVGNWSHCVLSDGNHGNASTWLASNPGRSPYQTKYCGVGKRYQALVCVDEKGNEMPASTCTDKDFTEEMCFIPCPIDGAMSPWSEWSECSSRVCGVGQQVRERYSTVTPLDGGRECPELDEGMEYQKRPCPIPCGHHSWQMSTWSDCSPISRPNFPLYPSCGPGLQSRTVRCVFKPPEAQALEVGEENCDPLTLPENTNYCHLPCTGQCVVSPWSEWSTCPPPCSKEAHRTRQRFILRKSSRDNEPCPHTLEKEPCILGNNCFAYVWEWSEWGPCTLGVSATCGHGQRQRVPTCRRNDGRGVSLDLCKKFIPGMSSKYTHEVCEVPCAEDCVMSEWTRWSLCSASCGKEVQSRERHVVHKQSNRGRQCPKDWIQYRPCMYIPCNRWSHSQWSPCQTQKGACGHGYRVREMWCQRSDGTKLDDLYCQYLLKPVDPLKGDCYIQCPGDCVLSEWLSWGPCHKPCGQNLINGTQTRARLIVRHASMTGQPCQPLLQTRTCSTHLCHSFHWATSEWVGQQREVWCERNDGLKTYGQGGCDENSKPSSKRLCPPSCHRIPSAFCTSNGQCACPEGLTPIYSESRLEECASLPTQGAGQIMTISESATTTDSISQLPEDGPTNFWMYAVIAAGCCFAVFVVIAVYKVCRNLHGPSASRPKVSSGDNASSVPKYTPVNGRLVLPHTEPANKEG